MGGLARGKETPICTESFFFSSLAVTLALCPNSQVSFLICQIIIKSNSFPLGFLNEVLRDVVCKKKYFKNCKIFFDKVDIKEIPQSLKFFNHTQKRFLFLKEKGVSLLHCDYPYSSDYLWGGLPWTELQLPHPSVRGSPACKWEQ